MRIAISPSRQQLAAFGVLFLLLLLRSWPRLVAAHLWAEDGAPFLRQWIEAGSGSLLVPHGGYLHLLPRLLVGLIFEAVPRFLPHAIVVASIAAYAFVASKPMQASYEEPFGAARLRFLLCLLLATMPGLHEVLGNAANLHAILFLWALITCLKGLASGFTITELLFFPLAVFSAGEIVVLLPLLIVRAWEQRRRALRPQLAQTIAAIVVMAVSVAVVFAVWQDATSPRFGYRGLAQVPFAEIGRAMLQAVANRIVVAPLLGSAVAAVLNIWMPLLVGAACALAGGLVGISRRERAQLLPLVGLLCSIGLIALTLLVRPGAESYPLFSGQDPWGGSFSRYGFLGVPGALLFWWSCVVRIRRPDLRSQTTAVIVAFALLTCAPHALLMPMGPERDWASGVTELRRGLDAICAGDADQVEIPINPKGWMLRIRAPRCEGGGAP